MKFSDESISGGGVRMGEESRVMPVVWLEQQVSRGPLTEMGKGRRGQLGRTENQTC